MEKPGAERHVVARDATVQKWERIRTGHFPITFEFIDGGGSDFRLAVAKLETKKVACGAYLTDLKGYLEGLSLSLGRWAIDPGSSAAIATDNEAVTRAGAICRETDE